MSATSTTKTDRDIKMDVHEELKWDATVDDTEVGVQVHNGLVTLTGNLDSYAKKLAARHAAHRVHGVLDVVDNTQVKVPVSWARTDEEIAGAVRHALKWDALVPEDRITSTVSSGTVTLQGNVDTWTQRWDAERVVHRLQGVTNVVNLIMVASKPVKADQIKEQIESALERQAHHEAKRIGVTVRDGVVTLTGAVRSWGEKNAIERSAGYALGVRRVDDQTVVDPYC
jgi:osmotically-inducible protein OsmY